MSGRKKSGKEVSIVRSSAAEYLAYPEDDGGALCPLQRDPPRVAVESCPVGRHLPCDPELAFRMDALRCFALLTISNADERRFYEIDAREHSWGARELERQIAASLYKRLALSRDKEGVRQLSQKGLVVEKPGDVIHLKRS